MPLQNSDDSEGLGFSELSFSKNIISEKFSPTKDSCTICQHLPDYPKNTVKNKLLFLIFWKFIVNKEKSRNVVHPDPFFHGEIAFCTIRVNIKDFENDNYLT